MRMIIIKIFSLSLSLSLYKYGETKTVYNLISHTHADFIELESLGVIAACWRTFSELAVCYRVSLINYFLCRWLQLGNSEKQGESFVWYTKCWQVISDCVYIALTFPVFVLNVFALKFWNKEDKWKRPMICNLFSANDLKCSLSSRLVTKLP